LVWRSQFPAAGRRLLEGGAGTAAR